MSKFLPANWHPGVWYTLALVYFIYATVKGWWFAASLVPGLAFMGGYLVARRGLLTTIHRDEGNFGVYKFMFLLFMVYQIPIQIIFWMVRWSL